MQVTGAAEVAAALRRIAGDVADLEPPNRAAGAVLVGIAEQLAPVETGALVRSIQAQASAAGLVVEAGAGLEYAAVQNKGWPGHNIEGTHYLDRAEEQAERVTVGAAESYLDRVIRAAGLN
jgi:hypothetical protein